MSSSNRFDTFSHADNASRGNSPESSNIDLFSEPLGDEVEYDYTLSPAQSPGPQSPGPQSPRPQSPGSAASDSADPAPPATTGSADAEMTEGTGDTATVGPSDLSIQGVGESLPAVGVTNKREFWKTFKESGRAALAAVEASKSKKIRLAQSARSVAVTIPSAAGDLQPQPEPAFDARRIRNPKWMKCAFMYSTVEHSRIPVGNPFGPEDGCQVTLGIDAGRYGPAHITLRFRIERQEQAASEEPKWHQFKATWRLGVVIDDANMIEDITIQAVNPNNSFGPRERFRSVPVEAKCPNERESDLSKLMVIHFNSNSVRLDQVDEKVFHGLEPRVQDTLMILFHTQGPFPDDYMEWGNHLIDAASFPPFWPYYYEDQTTVNCTLAETADIRSFCNGILCTYPAMRSANGGLVVDQEKRPVEDRSGPPRYHIFPRQLTWDQEEELGIFASMPVIRDVQFDKGQVVYLGVSAHNVFLLKESMLKLEGRPSQEVRRLKNTFHAFVRMAPNRNVPQESVPSEGMRIKLEWDNSDVSRHKPHVQSNKKQDSWFGTVINHEAGCKATGTHFCIWLNESFGSTSQPRLFNELRTLPRHALPLAWMIVEVDTTAAERKIKAAKLLADKTFNPDRLGAI